MLQKSVLFWVKDMKRNEIVHKEECSLLAYNTLRIDSVAQDVYLPDTTDEFVLLLGNLDNPLIIGRGSNILLSSRGISRPVVLTKNLNKINVNSPVLEAEAGAPVGKLSNMALELKLTGFEFLSCLPASLGGAVCMNAGAAGQTISDTFVSAKVYDSNEDKVKEFMKEDMEFSYRNSRLKNQDRFYLLSAKFKLNEAESFEKIQKLIDENFEKRKNCQPTLKEPNLGCVFKNPVVNGEKISAGKLLDECNLKSHPMGGAMVYHNHANFIINFNNATSMDYLCLMREMKQRVKDKFNINLEPEIIYIGEDKEEVKIWQEIIQK